MWGLQGSIDEEDLGKFSEFRILRILVPLIETTPFRPA